jgi:hypothetical protein
LDILYIADWIISSHESEEKDESLGYDQLAQKLLSYANDFGCGDCVEKDHKEGRYYPTRLLEDEIFEAKIIEKYDDLTFWDELVYRLTTRDLLRKFSPDELADMDRTKFFEETASIEESYEQEFADSGLSKLIISPLVPT